MTGSQTPALPKPIHGLLEPGALFEGALFRNLLRTREVELEPGMRFGVFKLVSEIGRGGMGVVWLAERDDGEYRQQVAIKCIVDIRSEQGAELFRRERQILSELRHPNIARLLDGGRRADGLLWFAMELIEGVAIDRHAQMGALTLEARLRLFADVIDAVSVAHARLVIHRDLKPSNVLVDADGRAKLLDFGIAAIAHEGDAARAYSPGWASPEQRVGDSVTAASDQFQLGMLLDAVLRSTERAGDRGVDGERLDA
ncbi:MAG: serine/threonine-protein kinase, partial [Lysobacterales bacterium]